jgi:hypothetical protein
MTKGKRQRGGTKNKTETAVLINAFKSFNSMKFFPQLCFCFLLISSFINPISAQIDTKETPQYKHALKGYLTITEVNTTNIFTDSIRQRTTNLSKTALLPSVSWVKFRKNGQFREMGITQFNVLHESTETENKLFQVRDSFGNIIPGTISFLGRGTATWSAQLGLQFEWNFPIYYRETRNFACFVGVSTAPTLYFEKITSFSSASFPSRAFELSNTLSIIPRMTYAVSNRLFVDINIPISFTTFDVNYYHVDSPILPTYARTTVNFRAHLPINLWAIRFGIGYKI